MTAIPENASSVSNADSIDLNHQPSLESPAPQTVPRAPRGFRFGSVAGGIKPSGRSDVCIIATDRPATVAGVYTTNVVTAAPVVWCRQRTPRKTFRAVATVSGNANACTGQTGIDDNAAIAGQVAEMIGCDADDCLVMSTGIIGVPLPMDRVAKGLTAAYGRLDDEDSASVESLIATAHCIRTTDDDAKYDGQIVTTSGGEIAVAGIAKGAGMINPNMATLLSVVMTDASIDDQTAHAMIRHAADASLNRCSVDGHTSTNDTLLLIASGTGPSITGDDLEKVQSAINSVCLTLAKRIVADGEGARHFAAIHVDGAEDDAGAETIARTIGASQLVKTAITGADPNWGRIVSAAGYASTKIDVDRTSLFLFDVCVYRDGMPTRFDAAALSHRMRETVEIPIRLTVGNGAGSAVHYASDLTQAYVHFNSAYTT